MKPCCAETVKRLSPPFVESQGATCSRCGTVLELRDGHWVVNSPVSTTMSIFENRQPGEKVDMGWARGTYQPDGSLLVECWGCGGSAVIPRRNGVTEMHFQHLADQCTIFMAYINKSKRFMPAPKVH